MFKSTVHTPQKCQKFAKALVSRSPPCLFVEVWMSNKDAWNDGNFDEIDAAFVNEKVTGGVQLLYKTSRALQTSINANRESQN